MTNESTAEGHRAIALAVGSVERTEAPAPERIAVQAISVIERVSRLVPQVRGVGGKGRSGAVVPVAGDGVGVRGVLPVDDEDVLAEGGGVV